MKIAQINFPSLEAITAPNFQGKGIADVVSRAVVYIFPLGLFLLLIFIVISGYQWMTSGNQPQKLQSAQRNMTYAIVGMIIIFLAYWIVQILGRALGIQAINAIFQ
jgi:branched-subunit amino acid transport protein AzlD